jgi:hypothetical protein
MTKNAYKYLVGIIIIGLIPVFTLINHNKEKRLLEMNGQKTIAEVYKVFHRVSKGHYIVYYRFKVNNIRIESTDKTYDNNIKVGDKFEVIYLPSRPKVNEINYDKNYSEKKRQDTVKSFRERLKESVE